MMIDTAHMINIEDLPHSGLDHTDELIALSKEAIGFLSFQPWCKSIVEGKLDRGYGYILAVFLFEIEPAFANAPDNVWIIVGDLPPAYIVVDDNPNGACAIDAYVMEMERWVDRVLKNESIGDLIPVNVPPTHEWAMELKKRLDIIRRDILLSLKEEINTGLQLVGQ